MNFDGLAGPTHSYAGLSTGNIASITHDGLVSNPKEAALQSLQKMKMLSDMGLLQGIIPPQERPYIPTLKSFGFSGSDADILAKVAKEAPKLLVAVSSASSMWTANAATVCPSVDAKDHRVHFTPANLTDKFHRSIEPDSTAKILKAIFRDDNLFAHHAPLLAGNYFGDEGAANHTRLCADYGSQGLQLFVFGRYAFDSNLPRPQKYSARQTFEASSAIARLHLLGAENVVLAQQNPDAIDAGVFHNDVISVGNQNVFFYHESAFLQQDNVISELQRKYYALTGDELVLIKVSSDDVSLQEAVRSYLFNSQLISISDNKMMLIVPSECQEIPSVNEYLKNLVEDKSNLIEEVRVLNLRQSMQNGGGPACLRLRVVLSEREIAATNPQVFLNDEKYKILTRWVNKHYRDQLSGSDLADPQLLRESRTALDELTQILGLGSIYEFQYI